MESASTAVDVITCLFTDIEGSTEKWEEEPKRMSLAVARHDALMRVAIDGHRGRVIKTTYAIFADAADGVRAVVAIQKSLTDPALHRRGSAFRQMRSPCRSGGTTGR